MHDKDTIARLVEAAISLCEPENADENATAYTRQVLTRRFTEILAGSPPRPEGDEAASHRGARLRTR